MTVSPVSSSGSWHAVEWRPGRCWLISTGALHGAAAVVLALTSVGPERLLGLAVVLLSVLAELAHWRRLRRSPVVLEATAAGIRASQAGVRWLVDARHYATPRWLVLWVRPGRFARPLWIHRDDVPAAAFAAFKRASRHRL